tara:strand:+ start:131 stop:565 length:435 start_codon:yes stop_codon:yes gene_type:complete
MTVKMSVHFIVPGQPVAKARARSTRSGRHYTPEKTVNFEKHVAYCATGALAGLPKEKKKFDGPVQVRIECFMTIPASWSKKKKAQALSGDLLPVVKPDLDNIAKSCLDAINGLVFVDDSQVCELSMFKKYSDSPRTQITVTGAA